jgi:hypothetical protein
MLMPLINKCLDLLTPTLDGAINALSMGFRASWRFTGISIRLWTLTQALGVFKLSTFFVSYISGLHPLANVSFRR